VQRDRVQRKRGRFDVMLGVGSLAVFSLVLGGCGRELSKSELGTVVFEVPKVAGAEKPYEMPKLGPRGKEDDVNPRVPLR
jgi:hypothetical protein